MTASPITEGAVRTAFERRARLSRATARGAACDAARGTVRDAARRRADAGRAGSGLDSGSGSGLGSVSVAGRGSGSAAGSISGEPAAWQPLRRWSVAQLIAAAAVRPPAGPVTA